MCVCLLSYVVSTICSGVTSSHLTSHTGCIFVDALVVSFNSVLVKIEVSSRISRSMRRRSFFFLENGAEFRLVAAELECRLSPPSSTSRRQVDTMDETLCVHHSWSCTLTLALFLQQCRLERLWSFVRPVHLHSEDDDS